MKSFLPVIIVHFSISSSLLSQTVLSVTPTPFQHSIDTNSHIQIVFSDDMEVTSLTNEAFIVHGSLTGRRQASQVAYDAASRAATLSYDAPFKVGETVSVTVRTDVKNQNAQALQRPFAWQFTTRPLASETSFGAPEVIDVGQQPQVIVAGDLDLDDDIDLAVCNRGSSNLTILINNNGIFDLITSVKVGDSPESVAIADLDGNGTLDLVVANRGDDTVTILGNSGIARFEVLDTIPVVSSPHAVSMGDFDGDGDPDIAVSSSETGGMAILLNDGFGSFSGDLKTAVGIDPEAGLIADIDMDGDFDLSVPDFNSGNVVFLSNDGSGVFSRVDTIATGTSPRLSALGDFDLDGDVDFVVPHFGSNNFILLSNDSGIYSVTDEVSVSGGPWAATSSDLNGDGNLDLIVLKYNSNKFNIHFGDGAGGFSTLTTLSGVSKPYSSVAADFDGNGTLDVAIANEASNTVTVFKNGSVTGVVSPATEMPRRFALRQNYPNPFNPSTTIEYELSQRAHTVIKVFNVQGREVRTLFSGVQDPGVQKVRWNGEDGRGRLLPSGVYFYRLNVLEEVITRRMLMLQ